LDVLEYFGAMKQPLRAKHVAQAFNLHPSSADQLLKTMVQSGYMIFDPINKVYDLSPRLTNFAVWLTSECFWDAQVSKILGELRARTRSMISLMQRTDDFMRIVDCLTVEEENYPRALGNIYPLDTVAGQAFLGSVEDEEAKRIVHHAVTHRHLAKDVCDDLIETVRHVRSVGHAVGNRYDRRIWSVSVPVPMHASAHNRTMVLSISRTNERMSGAEDMMIRAARECADTILKSRSARWDS
jgi:DNA-binding IclR family transcriptional regulator